MSLPRVPHWPPVPALGRWRRGTLAARVDEQPHRVAVHLPRAGTADPRFTVVITCYNYARFLTEAVTSALTQEGVTVDVVIVEDASQDDSAEVALDLSRSDPRVTVIVNQRNLGAVAAFNAGLALARGEYLVRLDADDLLTPGALRRAADLMQAFPSVGIVYGHPVHFADGAPLPPAHRRPGFWLVWPGGKWLSRICNSGANVITSPEAVVRRSVANAVGPMAALRHAHDFEWWLRFAALSDVGYVACDQAWHREHDSSLSADSAKTIVEQQERLAAFESFFASGAAGNIDAPALKRTVRRALARDALRGACHHYNRGWSDTTAAVEMAEFALQCDPGVVAERLWRSWELRHSLGPRASARRVDSIVWSAMRAIQVRTRRLRWSLTGHYH